MGDSKTFGIPEAKGLSTVAQKPEETCKQRRLLCEPETPGVNRVFFFSVDH